MATEFITISIEIMHDKKLSPNQKFIFAEIKQLCSLNKGCFASNSHFSNLIGISKQGVSNAINKLILDGYIASEIIKGSRNRERIITIRGIHSDVGGIHSDVGGIHSDVETKENKTINKTINIKNKQKNSLSSQISTKLQEAENVINLNAFNEWQDYKKYKSIAPISKTINFLSKYDFSMQQQIVDSSIMNGYKGLFEPKQQTQQKNISFQEQERQKTQVIGKAIMQQGFDPFDPQNYTQQNNQGVIDAELQS